MLVNDTEMDSSDATYELIDRMSASNEVWVQYADGALWTVYQTKWRKMNNA